MLPCIARLPARTWEPLELEPRPGMVCDPARMHRPPWAGVTAPSGAHEVSSSCCGLHAGQNLQGTRGGGGGGEKQKEHAASSDACKRRGSSSWGLRRDEHSAYHGSSVTWCMGGDRHGPWNLRGVRKAGGCVGVRVSGGRGKWGPTRASLFVPPPPTCDGANIPPLPAYHSMPYTAHTAEAGSSALQNWRASTTASPVPPPHPTRAPEATVVAGHKLPQRRRG